MKSLFQLILVLIALFTLYLYMIREEIPAETLIAQLESEVGEIDVLERKIRTRKDSLDLLIAKHQGANQEQLDLLNRKLELLQEQLQYNQKVARLQKHRKSIADQNTFDSLNIQPFKQQIADVQQEIMVLTPKDLHLKTKELRNLLDRFYDKRDQVNERFLRSSLIFYPPEAQGNRVVIENKTDSYGRPISTQSEVQVISNKLFGSAPPSETQVQNFRELHRFWCSLSYDHPEGYCSFPWLE